MNRSYLTVRRTLFAAAAFFVLLAVAAPSHGQTVSTIRLVKNPDPAPEINLPALDGKPLSIASARGKVVFLNFWATWCGPCRAEIPDLVELQNKYKDQLQIISLAVDVEDEDDLKKFVSDSPINYPVAVATNEIRLAYGGIPALPTSFVLDTEGRVVQKHVGLYDPSLYEAEIRALLGMPVRARIQTFEDTGQIFLKNAERASELPGVDLSHLTPEQKKVALHRLNAESCTCGCTLTLAQCRINDTACGVSKQIATKVVREISSAPGAAPSSSPENPPQPPAPADSAPPATPPPSHMPNLS